MLHAPRRRLSANVRLIQYDTGMQPQGISRWWRLAGGLSMNLALGTLYAWSVFVAPLESQFGWKRADTSMVFTIAASIFGLSFVMPALYHAGSNVVLLYPAVFVVYWCYGSQLSVNGAAAADFWGTKNAGVNYGMLFTAFGVSGILGPRIGGVLYDRYHNYQAAFYTASALAVIALLCEFGARRPVHAMKSKAMATDEHR